MALKSSGSRRSAPRAPCRVTPCRGGRSETLRQWFSRREFYLAHPCPTAPQGPCPGKARCPKGSAWAWQVPRRVLRTRMCQVHSCCGGSAGGAGGAGAWGLVGWLWVPLASRPWVGLGSQSGRNLRADSAHLAPRPGRHPASPPRGSARAGGVGPVPAVNHHSQFTAHPQSWFGSLQLGSCPSSAPSPAPRQPQGPPWGSGPCSPGSDHLPHFSPQ